MEVRLITDRRQWNTFVASVPAGHLCQTFEWAEHGEDLEARAGGLHVGVLDGDELVGAVLLLRSAIRRIPGALYYAPRGPVVREPVGPTLELLMQGAARFARQKGGFALRIEPNVLENDTAWLEHLQHLGFRPTTHTIYLRNAWVTDLTPDEDQMLAAMMMTWRQNIRAGTRKGLVVREGTTNHDFNAFYRLLSETAERDHFYLYPPQVFRDMLDHYSAERAARDATAQMRLFITEYQGMPIATSTVAAFGGWAWNLHSGSSALPEHRKLRPNYLTQWECMRWAKQLGCHSYDWRTIPEILEPGQELWGVYEFKRGFGGAVRRVMPTMDLVLNPLIYYPYTTAVQLRRARREQQQRQEKSTKEQPASTTQVSAASSVPPG